MVFAVLRLAAFFVLFGRAWQHLIWDEPYRSLLWEESWLSPIVELILGKSWDSYATDPVIDTGIQAFMRTLGVLQLAAGFLCLAPKAVIERCRHIFYASSVSLGFLALLYAKERVFELGQGIEYAAQFLAPLLVIASLRWPRERLVQLGMLAVVGTFLGHGLYALGYYPVPANFIDMTITILGVSERTARQLLFAAGVLDLLVCVLIFVPRLRGHALLYAAGWGLVTALARPLAYVDLNFLGASLNQTLPEFLYRLPHAFVPLAVYLAMEKIRRQTEKASRLSGASPEIPMSA